MSRTLTATETKDTIRIEVPVRDDDAKKENACKTQALEMMDPHSILAFLFKSGLVIPPGTVESYWKHARKFGQAWAKAHPASNSHVPVGVWGDGAKVFTEFGQYKMVSIFMNIPLWRPKSARYSRFLLFCIQEDKMFSYHTLLPIWRRITWSLNCAFEGIWPTRDPDGELIRDQTGKLMAGSPLVPACFTKFACTEIRGDWAWLKETFRFPKCAWNATKTCWKCPARKTSSDPSLFYYHHDGGWLEKEFDLVNFLVHRIPEQDPCHLAIAYKSKVRTKYYNIYIYIYAIQIIRRMRNS